MFKILSLPRVRKQVNGDIDPQVSCAPVVQDYKEDGVRFSWNCGK